MVAKMKLFTITGPIDSFDEVVQHVVQGQEFQPESAMSLMKDIRGVSLFPMKNPYTALLQQGQQALAQLNLEQCDTLESDLSFNPDTLCELFSRIESQVTALSTQASEAETKLETIAHLEEELDNLHGINEKLQDLRSMRFARFRFGYMPRESYDSVKGTLEAREDLFFIPTRINPNRVFGVYFTTLEAHHRVDALFDSLLFVRLFIDAQAEGSVDEELARLARVKQEAQESRAYALETLAQLRVEEGQKLQCTVALLQRYNDCYDLRRYAAHSHDNFYLIGWVPEEQVETVEGLLTSFPQVSTVIDDAEDLTAAITPPTKLKNNFFARIFEPFVAMFGLPKYGEQDPSFFMALTYTVLFGVMFGDLGQGLCLVLAGILITRLKKNWLGPIISCCGLSASVFGCIYGSVFGFEDILPGYKVMEDGNIMRTLQTTLFAGVFLLALVMVINIVQSLRSRDYHKGLFGANGIAGCVFYLAAVLKVADSFMGLGLPIDGTWYNVLFLALPILCVFFAEPLTRLMTKERPVFEGGVGAFLSVGLFELFETVLSYLTNTLSFLRVGAYAIIHVGMMNVVFLLAGDALSVRYILVCVFGNIFVMCFEGLLVGIQVLRLEFYELFGRFYSAGGRPYTGSPI